MKIDFNNLVLNKSIDLDKIKTKEVETNDIDTTKIEINEKLLTENDKYSLFTINGNEKIFGNQIIEDTIKCPKIVTNSFYTRKFIPDSKMTTRGDSYFVQQGSIDSVNNNVANKLGISNTFNNFSNNTFTLTFNEPNITRFYDKNNINFINSSSWFHLGFNDIIKAVPYDITTGVANNKLYMIDTNQHILCWVQALLFSACLPLNSIYLAKDIFEIKSGTVNLYWCDDTFFNGGLIYNRSSGPNSYASSKFGLKGKYYFFLLYGGTDVYPADFENSPNPDNRTNRNVFAITDSVNIVGYDASLPPTYNLSTTENFPNDISTVAANHGSLNNINYATDTLILNPGPFNTSNTNPGQTITGIQIYPVLLQYDTVKERRFNISRNLTQVSNELKPPSGPARKPIVMGILYCACWDDETGSSPNSSSFDKFRHVIIDTPPIYDFASIPSVANFSNTIEFNRYDILKIYQDRQFKLTMMIEETVRGMQQINLPVSINYWNNITHAWNSNYTTPHNSCVEVNANSFINNINIENGIPNNSNVQSNFYHHSVIL